MGATFLRRNSHSHRGGRGGGSRGGLSQCRWVPRWPGGAAGWWRQQGRDGVRTDRMMMSALLQSQGRSQSVPRWSQVPHNVPSPDQLHRSTEGRSLQMGRISREGKYSELMGGIVLPSIQHESMRAKGPGGSTQARPTAGWAEAVSCCNRFGSWPTRI